MQTNLSQYHLLAKPAGAACLEGLNQVLGDAAQAEPRHEEGGSVLDVLHRVGGRTVDLVHGSRDLMAGGAPRHLEPRAFGCTLIA